MYLYIRSSKTSLVVCACVGVGGVLRECVRWSGAASQEHSDRCVRVCWGVEVVRDCVRVCALWYQLLTLCVNSYRPVRKYINFCVLSLFVYSQHVFRVEEPLSAEKVHILLVCRKTWWHIHAGLFTKNFLFCFLGQALEAQKNLVGSKLEDTECNFKIKHFC